MSIGQWLGFQPSDLFAEMIRLGGMTARHTTDDEGDTEWRWRGRYLGHRVEMRTAAGNKYRFPLFGVMLIREGEDSGGAGFGFFRPRPDDQSLFSRRDADWRAQLAARDNCLRLGAFALDVEWNDEFTWLPDRLAELETMLAGFSDGVTGGEAAPGAVQVEFDEKRASPARLAGDLQRGLELLQWLRGCCAAAKNP